MAAETRELTPLEQCKACLSSKERFVLHGGAGSGKTETLKELLLYLKETVPDTRAICITHTNVAVVEIKSRVGSNCEVSTIHSFLNCLIKDYKKNIKSVISKLFTLEEMCRKESIGGELENDYKKAEHERYKDIYGKYANKLFKLKNEIMPQVTGKRAYDENPDLFNEELNQKIRILNSEIEEMVSECDYSKIHYNDTKFNSLSELSYGHDGLLEIFHLLYEKYNVLGKMIADKYDYIFIDEFQDTNKNVMCDFVAIAVKRKVGLALFGDSMQAIYSDGIGGVESFVQRGELKHIPKSDNFRCSHEVVEFINPLRFDRLEQKVVYKTTELGETETDEERRGKAIVLYSVCESKPNAYKPVEEKELYQEYIDELIEEAKREIGDNGDGKVLLLTNKSIAKKNDFQHLYEIFDDRFSNVKDQIETYLSRVQALYVGEICLLYRARKFNEMISRIRLGGFVIQTAQDKIKLKEHIDYLLDTANLSIWDAVTYARGAKLIKQSVTSDNIVSSNKTFVQQLGVNTEYQTFKSLYDGGKNTYSKMKNDEGVQSEEEFDYFKSLLKKERFIKRLFSEEAKFSEVVNYIKYLNEETHYITMHKTKGTSIPTVVVVMEEFFWSEYKFSALYTADDPTKLQRQQYSQKLIYGNL